MKPLQTSPTRILMGNDDSPFCYFGWPTIARLPDGVLALVASGHRLGHVCPFGKVLISYSRDEGATWSLPAIVMDTPLDDRDGGLTVFGDGRVMLTSFNNTIAFQRAWNARERGKTSDAALLARCDFIDAYLNYIESLNVQDNYLGSTYRISDNGGYTFGEVRRMPVTAPHGPCRLNDGRLLYVGRRFSEDDSFDDGTEPFLQCWTLDEQDEPRYISAIENVSDEHGLLDSCEPHALQLPDATILVHIRVQRSGKHPAFTLYQSESHDGGLHFSRPHPLLDETGGAPAHLLRHSSGVLISAYGHRREPFGIRVMLSRDGGQSWEIDFVLDDTCPSPDLGYPATVELSDGSLLTVYYENIDGVSHIVGRNWKLPD